MITVRNERYYYKKDGEVETFWTKTGHNDEGFVVGTREIFVKSQKPISDRKMKFDESFQHHDVSADKFHELIGIAVNNVPKEFQPDLNALRKN